MIYSNLYQKKNDNIHLMILVKVEFMESLGYRTLANLRKVNFDDKDMFANFLGERLGLLSDSYRVDPVSNIIFSYIVRDGVAEDTKPLLTVAEYNVTKHSFNNMVLPLSMNPVDFGTVLGTSEHKTPDGMMTRNFVENKN